MTRSQPNALGGPLLDALDRMGYGGILLDLSGTVLLTNMTATRILNDHADPHRRGSGCDWSGQALRSLLNSEGTHRLRTDQDDWVVVGRGGAHRPLVARSIPLVCGADTDACKAMVLVDLNVIPRPAPEVLTKIFGLTPFEARIAVELARGKSPEEIAAVTHSQVGTVRRQLASVFLKTNTHRQPELVALLVHLAILR
jgi:DNA-binding CsgD family transcriptional regulator